MKKYINFDIIGLPDDGGKKKPIDILLDNVDYKKVQVDKPEGNIPYVTHEGILELGGISIIVLQLSSGERVIPEEEFKKIFGDDWKEWVNPIL